MDYSPILAVATAAFVARAMLASWAVPPARGALPSILCHYALLFAFAPLTYLVHLGQKRVREADAVALARAG